MEPLKWLYRCVYIYMYVCAHTDTQIVYSKFKWLLLTDGYRADYMFYLNKIECKLFP